MNNEKDISAADQRDEQVELESTLAEDISEAEPLSEDEAMKREVFEKIMKEMQKEISIEAIGAEEESYINTIIELLIELKNDVVAKRTVALEKSSLINKKIHELVTTGNVKINREEFDRSEASVNEYSCVLQEIFVSIESKINYFSSLLTKELPTTITVLKTDPDSFVDFIKAQENLNKKYVKNTLKDLRVSFSRYCHGFDQQVKNLVSIERYLKVNDIKEVS